MIPTGPAPRLPADGGYSVRVCLKHMCASCEWVCVCACVYVCARVCICVYASMKRYTRHRPSPGCVPELRPGLSQQGVPQGEGWGGRGGKGF